MTPPFIEPQSAQDIPDYGQSSMDPSNILEMLQSRISGQSPAATDPNEKLRDFLRTHSADTVQDLHRKRTHTTPEENAKRGKLGNFGNFLKNQFESDVLGRNTYAQSERDFGQMTQRMGQGNETLRATDAARRSDEDRQLRELLGKQTADIKDSHEENIRLRDFNKNEREKEKNLNASHKTDIAEAWNKGRLGTAADKQAAINKLNDYKMAHPDERPESFIADALIAKSPTGKLDIAEYQSALNDFYKSQSLRQGPIVRTTEVPTLNAEGTQTGTSIVPTLINRQTGATSTAGAPQGAAASAPGTVPFGPQGNGNTTVPKTNLKDIEALRTPIPNAKAGSQNLLQDLGTGKLNDYTGFINGSRPMEWLREQGFAGGTSTGEAYEKFLSPTNVIQHIRSMSPRINQKEIDSFTSAIGSSKQKGEVLAKKAIIYTLSLEHRLQEKMGAIPQIPDGAGGTKSITDTPEFVSAMRESIEQAVDLAKKTKGAVAANPSLSTILESTRAKLQSNQAKKTEEIRNKLKEVIPPPASSAVDELKKRGIL